MSDGTRPGSQLCALQGCAEPIEQPEIGGPRQLYCTHDHKFAARRLRSIARTEAEPAQPVPSLRPQGGTATWIADPFAVPGGE